MKRDEYIQDAFLYAKRGNELPHAKLNAEKVRAIRANRHGKTAKQLGEEYGVHLRTIEKIRSYETWIHV